MKIAIIKAPKVKIYYTTTALNSQEVFFWFLPDGTLLTTNPKIYYGMFGIAILPVKCKTI